MNNQVENITPHHRDSLRITTLYELMMMLLSIVSVVLALLLLIKDMDPGLYRLLRSFDLIVCGVFFLAFWTGFWRAEHKWEYAKSHWFDLVAAIPFNESLRLLRVVQVYRVIRVLYLSKGKFEFSFVSRLSNTVAGLLLLELLVIFVGSFVVFYLETGLANAPITEPDEAIWWALVTVSTVGYGDFYPITEGGRLAASVLIVIGVGNYGLLSGYFAQQFLGRDEEEDDLRQAVLDTHAEVKSLRADLKEVRQQLSELTKQRD
ncbi:potassium channel family protein [Neiella marina]|uniref:Potassium channel family protein n=1 Tax=Neiella holothuriorum TaxID=2870530 RepID=A0ABS7EKN8_9GAMM|nr:potassium channel family protein [Neiella holothuriorum]MBW8192247.1 potassium channel family protein [Neiella holothuriorum]